MSSSLTKTLTNGRSLPLSNSFGAEAGILLHQVVEHRLARSRRSTSTSACPPVCSPQRRRDLDLDRHVVSNRFAAETQAADTRIAAQSVLELARQPRLYGRSHAASLARSRLARLIEASSNSVQRRLDDDRLLRSRSTTASCVFRPLPVMQRTISSSRGDPALLDQLPGDGQGDAAGRLGEDALGLGQELHRRRRSRRRRRPRPSRRSRGSACAAK